jgi:hypothetical protein
VVDVQRKGWIRPGVIEGLRQKDLVDGIPRRLDAASAGKVFLQRFADEVPEGHPPRFGCLGSVAVKVGRQQQLGSVHV